MNKTKRTIFTILLILVIIILTVGMIYVMQTDTLLTGCGGNSGMRLVGFSIGPGSIGRLQDAKSATQYTLTADEQKQLKSIDASFLYEDVTIKRWDKNTVQVEQTAEKPIDEKDYMRYDIKDGTFMLESAEMHQKNKWVHKHIEKDMLVTIYIPKDMTLDATLSTTSGNIAVAGNYHMLHIDTVSGDALSYEKVVADTVEINATSGNSSFKDTECNVLNFDAVSGSLTVDGWIKQALHTDTTSGDINATGVDGTVEANTISGTVQLHAGQLLSVNADTTSGDFELWAKDVTGTNRIEVDSVSGNVSLHLPDNDGFTLAVDTVSGDVSNNEFPMLGDVHESGRIDIQIDTSSGDVSIYRNQ